MLSNEEIAAMLKRQDEKLDVLITGQAVLNERTSKWRKVIEGNGARKPISERVAKLETFRTTYAAIGGGALVIIAEYLLHFVGE